jgi:hypothetical protein
MTCLVRLVELISLILVQSVAGKKSPFWCFINPTREMVPKTTKRFFPADNDDFILIENGVKNNNLSLKMHKNKLFEFRLDAGVDDQRRMARNWSFPTVS